MEGITLERLQVIISAQTEPLRRELQRVQNEVRTTTRQVDTGVNKIKNAFKKAAKIVAAALSVAAIITFGKSCIELGSDLAEVQNVVDVTFGSMSESVNEFARTAIRQFGLSETSAKQYTSTIGAMLKSMGLMADEVKEMSITLAGLAGDIASFYNLSGDDAFAKIRSGISGETEPLKQLGINMSVANMEAFALSQGIKTAYNEMTQAQQVTLRYNYLLSVTKDAQGDFARTSGGWANQVRILSESFNSVKASIGQGLINVLTPVIQLLNIFVSKLQYAADLFKSFTTAIFGDAGGTSDAISSAVVDTNSMADYMEDTAESAEKAKRSVAGFDKLNNISSGKKGSGTSGTETITPVSGSNEGIASIKENIGVSLKKIRNTIDEICSFINTRFGSSFQKIKADGLKNFKELKKNIKQVWQDIASLKTPLYNWFNNDYMKFCDEFFQLMALTLDNVFSIFNMMFGDIWNIVLFPMFEQFITVGLPIVTQFATSCVSIISVFETETVKIFKTLWSEGIAPVLELLTDVWCSVIDTLASAWNKWGNPIFKGIEEAIKNTSAIIQNIWKDIIKPIWDEVIKVIDELYKKHIQPLLSNILDFIGELITCALEIYNKFISPIVNWLVNTLGPIFSSVFNGILSGIGAVIGNIIDYFNGFVTILKGIIQFIKGVFTGDWNTAWEGIKNIFGGIWDSLVSLAKIPINYIIGFINAAIGGIEAAMNFIVKAVNKLSFTVPSWVPGIGGNKFGFDLPRADFGRIEYLAKGGIVNSATLAMIGEAGKEAVIPLENNTGWLQKLSQMLLDNMNYAGVINAINNLTSVVGNGNIYLTMELDGDVVYKKMVRRNQQSIKRTGKSDF